MEWSLGVGAEAPFVFGEPCVGIGLSHRLDAFVREQQDGGAELVTGSE